jgi:hypothetical protein
MNRFSSLSPGCPSKIDGWLHHVIEFWNSLSCLDSPGETTWEVLEVLKNQVSDCLCRHPINRQRVESLTAKAALLMTGQWHL